LRHTFMSPVIESVLGYPVELWLGDPSFWQSVVDPGGSSLALVRAALATEPLHPIQAECSALAADGRVIWMRTILCRGVVGSNELLGISFDVTNERMLYEELAASRLELRALAARADALREKERTATAHA